MSQTLYWERALVLLLTATLKPMSASNCLRYYMKQQHLLLFEDGSD